MESAACQGGGTESIMIYALLAAIPFITALVLMVGFKFSSGKSLIISLIVAIILAVAVVFIVVGIRNGSMMAVVNKAIRICTECVGLG